MRNWICRECGKDNPCKLAVRGADSSEPEICPFDLESNWRKDEAVTQLPKLTADIFNDEDCPEWAEYAAVDRDGEVWVYSTEPHVNEINEHWETPDYSDAEYSFFAECYDASDWKNSLVQRVRYTSDGVVHVRFKKLHENAKAPYQATVGSAGFDLTAVRRTLKIEDGYCDRMVYGTGLAVEIPQGHVGLVFPRSSVHKTGMLLTNCVGVIDSDYRGEITAVFTVADSDKVYEIGDRICQLVIMPIPAVKFVEAEELSETQRGAGGYGSTGR